MAEKEKAPIPAIKRSEDGQFVHYGFKHDGAFHPIAADRASDYDDRVKAAQEDDS